MTMGTGYEGLDDLATQLSAVEDQHVANKNSRMMVADPSFDISFALDPSDGVNYSGGSSHSEYLPLLPSSAGLVGIMGLDQGHEAKAALCSNLGNVSGLTDILKEIGKSDRYLLNMAGQAWPTRYNAAAVDQSFLTPTARSVNSNINKGWNAAAQPGSAPGVRFGFPQAAYKDIDVGALSYEQALKYAPSPLAEKAAALAGLGAVTGSTSTGMRVVLDASRKPGTQKAASVSRGLLEQSLKIAGQTQKRASVMEHSRQQYRSLLTRVTNIDSETQRLASVLFEPNGEPKSNVSPAQIASYRRLRQQAFDLGREAIRFQKTNVIATALTKNGYAQAQLLQNMAATLLTGAAPATAVMAVQFEDLGKENTALRAQREAQVTHWRATNAREGLSGLQSPARRAVTADYWEAELAGMEVVEMAYLGALEGLWGSIKKATRSVSRVAKAASKVASKAARSVSKAAQQVGTQAARVAAAAAKKAAKYTTPVINTVKAISRPIGQTIKAGARIVTEPIKMTYNVGKYAVRGDIGGALNSVARSVKNTANAIATAAAASTIGLMCSANNTPIGRAVSQVAGAAVGTLYGGPVGGAVGSEAGRRANQVSQGVCAGMDRIGLTQGKFRPKQIGPAFKQSAKAIYNASLNPKAILQSAMNVGMNYATGGVGGGAVGAGASKLLAGQLSTKAIQSMATKALQKEAMKYGQQLAQRNIARIPALRKLNRSLPIANAVMQASGAFSSGGRVDLNALRQQVQQQGTRALKREAQKRARRLIQQQATRLSQQLMPASAANIIGQAAGAAVGSGGRVDFNALRQQGSTALRAQLEARVRQQLGVPGALIPTMG